MGVLIKDQIIVPGPIVNLALAAAANAQVVFTIPVLVGQLVGTKSVIIRRVNLYNNAAGNQQVLIGIGVGAGFVPLLPALDSMNGLFGAYGFYGDLVQAEAFANVTAYPAALAGAGTIDIQLEVEIRG
jgi:hypothetical protein